MKFQHELFYHAIPIIGNMLQGLLPSQFGAIDVFCKELEGLLFTFIQHGRYADDYVSVHCVVVVFVFLNPPCSLSTDVCC